MRSASLTIATFSTDDVSLFMRPIPLHMMNQWVMYGFRIGRNASGLGTDPINRVYSNVDPYFVAGPTFLHSFPDFGRKTINIYFEMILEG